MCSPLPAGDRSKSNPFPLRIEVGQCFGVSLPVGYVPGAGADGGGILAAAATSIDTLLAQPGTKPACVRSGSEHITT